MPDVVRFMVQRGMRAFILTLFATVGAAASAAPALEPIPIELMMSMQLLDFEAASASPDGEWLAYTLTDPKRMPGAPLALRAFNERGVPLGKEGTDIWISEVKSGKARNLTGGKGANWAPVWSMDGACLAFYSDRDGVARLWVYERHSGQLRKVSDAPVRALVSGVESEQMPVWMPDHKRIIVKVLPAGMPLELWMASPSDSLKTSAGKPAASTTDVTVTVYQSSAAVNKPQGPVASIAASDITQDVNSIRNKADLAIIDVQTGEVERIAQDEQVVSYRLSPDGSQVAMACLQGLWRNNLRRFVFDLKIATSGHPVRTVASNIIRGSATLAFSWSPDGHHLVYRGGSEVASSEADILTLVSRDGVDKRSPNPAAPRPLGVQQMVWSADGSTLYSVAAKQLWRYSIKDNTEVPLERIDGRIIDGIIPASKGTETYWSPDGGRSLVLITRNLQNSRDGFYVFDPATRRSRALMEVERNFGPELYRFFTSGDGRRLFYLSQSVAEPPNYFAVDGLAFDRAQRVTQIASEFDRYAMGASRLVQWRDHHGRTLWGSLLLPAGYQRNQKYPLIVWVYPRNSYSGTPPGSVNVFGLYQYQRTQNMQLFATRGYAVLMFGPPVSIGTSMKDIAATTIPGVNKVVEMGIADPDRLGIMGGSYGGFATLSLIVQSTLFKAAISQAGSGNLLGQYGQMSSDGAADGYGMVEANSTGGTPWEVPHHFINNSPVLYLDRVQTPLLIVHGANDVRVAPFLADEIFVGLRRLNKEVVYAKYAGEGHGFTGYANQIDFFHRMEAWFDRHLKGIREPSPTLGEGSLQP